MRDQINRIFIPAGNFDPRDPVSRAAQEFDLLWGKPKTQQGTNESINIPDEFQQYIETQQKNWMDTVLNGQAVNPTKGPISEILCNEMISIMNLVPPYQIRITPWFLDFASPHIDLELTRQTNHSEVKLLGLDVVRNREDIASHPQLFERGYTVFKHQSGLLRGSLNFLPYNNQDIPNNTIIRLLELTVSVLKEYAYSDYELGLSFSILKAAEVLNTKKSNKFLDEFYLYASDVRSRFSRILLDGAKTVAYNNLGRAKELRSLNTMINAA